MSKEIIIIGAGPMGLATAYYALKKGYKVQVFEARDKIGGMSETFDFSGMNIEKYYHFVCGPDTPLFNLMKELNIYDKLKWTDTKMGFFYNGSLYKWGDPISLLKFPHASFIDKIRYGLSVFFGSKIRNYTKLDEMTSIEWLTKWQGIKNYNKFWDPLFELKFYDLKDKISASWLMTRVRRVAKSRKNIFQERMGYIAGSSDTVTLALYNKIIELGGEVHLSSKITEVIIEDSFTKGVKVGNTEYKSDTVISTIPIQYISSITPNLPVKDIDRLNSLDNVGVVCLIVKLTNEITENFWLNINDSRIDVPGMISISNLNIELEDKVVYLPFYLHISNQKYHEPDINFYTKFLDYAKIINSEFDESWVKDYRVFKYEYAQPVATTEFLSKLPTIRSSDRKGFLIADTAYYYPEDRSITESIDLGKKLVEMI